MASLEIDSQIHASLQAPKPQPPCCRNCQRIPPSVACHELGGYSIDNETSGNESDRRYWLQPSIDALKQSAADGCPLCALLYRKCLQSFHGNPHEWEHGNGDPRFEITHGGPAPYVLDTRIGDWHVQGFDFVAAPADWSKRYSAYFNQIRDQNLLKFWVDECTSQHMEHCASKPNFLPTRLIDLRGLVPGKNSDIVGVIETASSEIQDRRYLALSHRWDQFTVESAQSTLENIAHRQRGISLTSLPRTFQYAASVARQLGVRYLWIDSLCILQDSKEDWMQESAQMGQVYGAAFCTIATSNDALEAYNSLEKDQTSSHLSGPDEAESLPNWVQVYVGKSVGNNGNENEVASHLVRIFDKRPWDWESMLEKTVLSGRGWTLQERQLSPRIVHVTPEALLWECRTCRGSDQVPWTDQVAANMEKEARYRIKDMIDNPRHTPRRSDPSYHYSTWYELVWDYSNRLLTKDTDKLPGLAGLAKTMAKMVDDEYAAGLWKKDIISGLLWKSRRWPTRNEYKGHEIPGRTLMPAPPGFYPSGPHGPIEQSRPKQRRAPTWSWASLDGQVIHLRNYYDPEWDKDPVIAPESVAVDMSFPGSDADLDPFSQADGGQLTVTGYLQPAIAKEFLRDLFLDNLDSEFWTKGYKSLHEWTETEPITLSCYEASDMSITATEGELRRQNKSHSDQEIKDCIGIIQYDVVDEIVPNQVVHVLALRRLKRQPSWQDDTPCCVYTERDERGFFAQDQVFGLALVPTGRTENEYKRVGLVEFVTASWFKEGNKETVTIA